MRLSSGYPRGLSSHRRRPDLNEYIPVAGARRSSQSSSRRFLRDSLPPIQNHWNWPVRPRVAESTPIRRDLFACRIPERGLDFGGGERHGNSPSMENVSKPRTRSQNRSQSHTISINVPSSPCTASAPSNFLRDPYRFCPRKTVGIDGSRLASGRERVASEVGARSNRTPVGAVRQPDGYRDSLRRHIPWVRSVRNYRKRRRYRFLSAFSRRPRGPSSGSRARRRHSLRVRGAMDNLERTRCLAQSSGIQGTRTAAIQTDASRRADA